MSFDTSEFDRKQQARDALRKALDSRHERAQAKRQIRRGELSPGDLIRSVPWWSGGMRIGEVISAQRRWGPEKMKKFLGRLEVRPHIELKKLTERQRNVVADAVDNKQKEQRVDNPKMAIMQYVYNRPEASGAVGQVMDEYLRIKTSDGLAPEVAVQQLLNEVNLTGKEFIKRRQAELDGTA